METTDPREHTLRKIQAVITRYMEHQVEQEPAFLDIVEEMEAAGYGSIGEAPGREV